MSKRFGNPPNIVKPVIANDGFIENFSQGIANYSVTGNALFSVLNNVMSVSQNTSALESYANRNLTNSIRVRNARFDFRLTLLAADDAPSIGFSIAGIVKIGFLAAREAALDAAQRPFMIFDGVTQAVGTTAVNVGTWYRANLFIRPGAGQSGMQILVRDTNAIFAQTAFSGDVAQQTINQTTLYVDNNASTCPIETANWLCW